MWQPSKKGFSNKNLASFRQTSSSKTNTILYMWNYKYKTKIVIIPIVLIKFLSCIISFKFHLTQVGPE